MNVQKQFKKSDRLLVKAKLISNCSWCNKSLKDISNDDKILYFAGNKPFAFCSVKCLRKFEKKEGK